MDNKQNNANKRRNKEFVRLCLLGALVLIILCAAGLYLLLRGKEPDKISPSSSLGSGVSSHSASAAGETAGWFVQEGKAFYRGADGVLYTGSREVDGKTCRFLEDGALVKGWVNTGDTRYYAAGGLLVKGWQDIEGRRYYFGKDGVLACSTTIDGIALGEDGAAITSSPNTPASSPTTSPKNSTPVTSPATPTTTHPIKPTANLSAELARRLDDILERYGRTPRNIYDYVHDHYTYKYTAEKSLEENAQHLLDYGKGSCYNFAALTYLLFQRAGYDVYYVTGLGWQHGTYHCWILANFDGGWYYVDSLYVRSAKLTADELTKKGYKWDQNAFPS